MSNTGRKAATRVDVAKKACVSTGTVSHVLSGSRNVSPDVRARVLQAVDELGYRPNKLAGGLGSRHARLIGLLTPDFENPHFSRLVKGVNDEAASEGYIVLQAQARDDYSEIFASFLEWRVSAVILSVYDQAIDLSALIDADVPIVTCGYQFPQHPKIPWVMPDHDLGTNLGVDHVVGLGHNRIGLLAGNGTVESDERLNGWIAALKRWKLAPSVVNRCYYDPVSAEQSAQSFVDNDVTCILAANDVVALSLMGALQRLGVRIPEDISVMGYDDTWLASHTFPRLSSIRIHSEVMGSRSADMALQKINGLSPDNVRVATELIVRDSTAAIVSNKSVHR